MGRDPSDVFANANPRENFRTENEVIDLSVPHALTNNVNEDFSRLGPRKHNIILEEVANYLVIKEEKRYLENCIVELFFNQVSERKRIEKYDKKPAEALLKEIM